MSLELKGVSIGEYYTDVKYRIEHWGETVVHDDSLTVKFPKSEYFKKTFNATIHITDCEADSYEEALDKLARWMTRLAQGIMERGEPISDFSPMYDNKKPEVMTHVSMGIEIPTIDDYHENDDYVQESGYTIMRDGTRVYDVEPARVVYEQGGLKVYDDDDEQ